MAIRQQWAPLLDKEGLLSSCPAVPALFLPFFLSSPPEANLLSFSFSLACIVPVLSVSPEGIVLASIPASSFPLRGQRTPFHANYMLSGGLLSRQPENAGTRLIKLGNIPLPTPSCSYRTHGRKKEFWLAGCSSVPLPPLTDRLGEAEERGDGGH